MRILNLEQGRPDRLTARRLLLSGLENARRSGDREVKLIHGYGSHGVGGSIRPGYPLRSAATAGGGEDPWIYPRRRVRALLGAVQTGSNKELGTDP